jgi:uncharacterized protein YbaP (TraB family)
MKNLNAKRLLCMLIVIMMLTSSMTYIVSAADEVAVTDMYSPWAEWEIFMAQDVYNLGNEGTYSNFRGSFTWMKFTPVLGSLMDKFGLGMSALKKDEYAYTRGETIKDLYNFIIKPVLEIEEPVEALDYFVKNGLINGRAKGDYQLDKTCTTEEMIIFSVRVYEYLAYELDLDSKGLFWKITGKDLPNTVYLLGTMHAGDSSVYPLSKAMLEAFDKSAYLAVEANIYTMTDEDMIYIMGSQMITGGKTIKDYLTEETYKLYKEFAESMGMPAEVYDYIKPWAAMLSIQQAMAGDDSAGDATSAFLGLDMHFLMKAVTRGKEILEIESIKYQMDMFNSFSPELQEMLLLSVIMPPPADEEGEEAMSQEEFAAFLREFNLYMLEAIKSGDEAALTEILVAGRDYSDPLMKEYNTKLWDVRDAGMAETIEQYLAYEDAEGDFFVAVGAGHTVGETGIVQVLKDKGYKVERIK